MKSNAFAKHTEVVENMGVKTPAFGIDLGTTNSCIAVIRTGRLAEPIQLSSGGYTLPSCVMWKGKDKFIVGKEAYNNRFKQSVAYSTKRIIGSNEMVVLKYGREVLETTPTFIASKILEALVQEVAHLYPTVKDVVITVPAYFNNNQVQATIEAGKLCGLNVLQTLREPTSAIHAYEIEDVGKKKETVLVYDLGGGTYDASLVDIDITDSTPSSFESLYGISEDSNAESDGKTVYRVRKVGGDNKLGGDDIDLELLNIAIQKLEDMGIQTKYMNKEDRGKLLLSLEKMKKDGAKSYVHKMSLKVKGEVKKIDLPLEPQDFVEATQRIYRKTRKIVNDLLAGEVRDYIDRICLVGGSTKSEILRNFIKRDFPNAKVSYALNPDESVALGAAVYAKKLKFGDNTVETFDILPIGIGIVSDRKLKVMVPAGQSVPCSLTEVFSTVVDNQEEVSVEIRQGDSSVIEKSVSLGTLVVSDLPKAKAGTLPIVVQLKIDANGLLSCTAKANEKVVKAEILNVFGGETKSYEEVIDKETENMISRWTRLAGTLDEVKSASIMEVIESLESGSINLDEAKPMVTEILSVSKVKMTTKLPAEGSHD